MKLLLVGAVAYLVTLGFFLTMWHWTKRQWRDGDQQ
jgi:hypothetical protein